MPASVTVNRYLPLLALAGLAACGAIPLEPDPEWFARVATWHSVPEHGALPAGWEAGLAAAGDLAIPQTGDRVLYLARLIGPEVHEELWVAITTLERADDERRVPLRFEVFESDGQLVGSAEHTIHGMHLTSGLHPAAQELARRARRLEPTELGPILAGLHSLRAILGLIEEDPNLSPLLWRVVRKPSLWSILTHLGVEPSIELGAAEVAGLAPPAGASVALRTPIRLDLNDRPALRCSVVSIAPRAPYTTSGGILSLAAERPDGPRLRFELHLVAAGPVR